MLLRIFLNIKILCTFFFIVVTEVLLTTLIKKHMNSNLYKFIKQIWILIFLMRLPICQTKDFLRLPRFKLNKNPDRRINLKIYTNIMNANVSNSKIRLNSNFENKWEFLLFTHSSVFSHANIDSKFIVIFNTYFEFAISN